MMESVTILPTRRKKSNIIDESVHISHICRNADESSDSPDSFSRVKAVKKILDRSLPLH